MILYFSATGNTKYIADMMAKELDDECINLLNKIKNNDYSEIHSEKPFIICSPVYVCEIPNFFINFLKKVKLTGNMNVYCILTSGGYAGISSLQFKRIMKKKKMKYMGRKEFKMPRNYIASNTYPLLPKDEILRRINNSTAEVHEVVDKIKNNEFLKGRHIWLFEIIVTVPFVPVWNKIKIKTKKFYVKDSCIGCHKCEKLCPFNNIKIENGKPVWNKKCIHCMACVSNCPKESIEYKKYTENKERYIISKYLDEIEK